MPGHPRDDEPSGADVSRHPEWPLGWTVEHVEETGSTNDDLVELAARGAPDRTVLVTDHQTAGRGRLDRRWDAPPGTNLLASILFRSISGDPGEATRRVGLAAIDAARRLAGVDATLKWPNDVLVGDAKLAGILAQGLADGAVVVGLGMNVGWAPPGAVGLGATTRPLPLLAAVLTALDGLPEDVHERYRHHLSTIGRAVRVELPTGAIVGRAVDVERDGRLVVFDDRAVTHRVAAGDVVHLRSS